MQLKDLKAFFESKIKSLELRDKISNEVINYHTAIKGKKGGSVPVYLSAEENETLLLTFNHFKKLCTEYINGIFSNWDMYYIGDVITLSNNIKFENATVKNLFESITDPEINGEINKEGIMKLIS